MVKVTKGLINGNRFRIGKDMLSNGHWAIRTERVSNAALLATVELASQAIKGLHDTCTMDAGIDTVLPKGDSVRAWEPLSLWTRGGGKNTPMIRLFRSALGEISGVNQDYLTGLDVDGEALYGTSEKGPFMDAATADHSNVVVMPTSIGAETLQMLSGKLVLPNQDTATADSEAAC
jgi:hypothetical protein